MAFSQDFIEKVRESSNIVDEISSFTELKRSGSQLTGLCPFPGHNEKTASFSVSESKQVYHCFGCKKSGNIFNFLQELRGYNFPEAIEYLANKASIPIPKEEQFTPKKQSQPDKKKQLLRVNQLAQQFYQQQLKKNLNLTKIKNFLQKRGINPEIAETFKLGYSTESWNGLLNFLRGKGVPQSLIQDLGLIRKSKKTGDYFDLYRERIMFPILNPLGECIGFGGRVLDDSLPKYINSSESDLFNKSKTLYGLNESAKHIRSMDYVVVVEGYMDLIALYSAGIKNVVATLGTALTTNHAKLLKRHCKKVIVLFDGDQAGRLAAEKSLSLLLSEGLMVHGLFLPNKMDPDDFIHEFGKEKLQQNLRSSMDLFFLVLDSFLLGFSGQPSEIVTIIDKVVRVLANVKDPVLLEIYKNEVLSRLKIDKSVLNKALASYRKSQMSQSGSSPPPQGASHRKPQVVKKTSENDELEKIIVKNPPPAEKMLLNIALISPKYFKIIVDSGVVEHFSHESLIRVFAKAEQINRQMPNKFDNLTALLGTFVEPQTILAEQFKPVYQNASEEEIERMIVDCQSKINDSALKKLVKKTKVNLSNVQDQNQRQELEQIMNIYRDKHKIKSPK